MKGKIYKNKLSITSPINTPIDHLNTQISSIIPPYSHYMHHPNSPGSQILSPKAQNSKKSFIHQLLTDNFPMNKTNTNNQAMTTFIDQLNQQFTTGYEQANTHETNTIGTINNILNQINSPNRERAHIHERQTGESLLKRVVSNPNITSYQYLGMQQNNKEDDIDPIDEGSILDKSMHSNYSKFRPNNFAKSNNNQQFNNVFDNIQSKQVLTNTRPLSQIPSQQQFTATSPYNSPIYNSQNLAPNLLHDGSNLIYQSDQQFLRSNLQFSQTDYITQYQKRHKQRISALESQHQLELQFYEEQLKTRDQTIQQMKKMLKQKEDIIRRLQSENANLSSRSYVSFANGNCMNGKD